MIQIDMEMPGKCSECRFNIKTGGYSKDGNLVAVDFCSLQYQGYEQGNEDRPEWCPLKEAAAGHWEWQTEDIYRCSECSEDIHVKEVMNVPQYEWCPMCGARMIEPQESEEI